MTLSALVIIAIGGVLSLSAFYMWALLKIGKKPQPKPLRFEGWATSEEWREYRMRQNWEKVKSTRTLVPSSTIAKPKE